MSALPNRLRSRRRRSVGASAVEFALVAPIFFGALFGTLDGGLLLFSANAIEHSVGIGLITVAQEGTTTTADTDAVAAIKAEGFGTSGFAKVDEVDIFLVSVDPTTGAVTADTNSCSGSPCLNRYTINGGAVTGYTNNWPASSRNTSSTSLNNVGITMKCHYNYLAFNSSSVTLNITRYFRLEPTS
jgi:Flp pilus assembly protein TadG